MSLYSYIEEDFVLSNTYTKNKKARYGIKFYELRIPNEYVLNIEIYKGKINPNARTVDQTFKIYSLVLKLMDSYLDRGHYLFMDNYYNCFNLQKNYLKDKPILLEFS